MFKQNYDISSLHRAKLSNVKSCLLNAKSSELAAKLDARMYYMSPLQFCTFWIIPSESCNAIGVSLWHRCNKKKI